MLAILRTTLRPVRVAILLLPLATCFWLAASFALLPARSVTTVVMPVTALNAVLRATAPADYANMVTFTKREPINSSVKTALQTDLNRNRKDFRTVSTAPEIAFKRVGIEFIFKLP